ncbi:PP2C family protein-serine/threonine phosphatase [Calycomorphotria hydatis]|uniref:Phosphoserine phosphatase RsbU n=1 Tax=Calycomorphotria hydatis TaxID=2528027 RepID=A0A517TE34_9PLAN|nr:PP2C family protein-serine/threonine phosphatase [Calycomorphotria hydatis]QDT66627.1 Phosphoserine phosphatase RsbU [Calycomorphotria hydatis]
MEQAVRDKRSNLTDEAIAVHAAVAHLSGDHGTSSVQRYIDTVCQRMRNAWSPHHHIVVEFSDKLLSDSRSRSGTCLQLGNRTAGQKTSISDVGLSTSHVSGTYSSDTTSVVISETTDTIRRTARKEILTQLGTFGLLGALATATVNLMLLRIVDSPLKKLLAVVDQISAGCFGMQTPEFQTHEMQQLASGINSMSHALAVNDRERRIQMCKAREIQQHLLPNGVKLPHLHTAHIFEPAEDVAGDYYDFLPLSNGSWLICIADVTGHGVPAAMGASMLKALLLTESSSVSFELLTTMRNINRRFTKAILPGNFASMFLGCWDPESLMLTYASAGHDSAILLRASGSVEELEGTGLLLGIDPDADWKKRAVQLSHANRVLLFSDGATESLSLDGKLFGRTRLTESLAANSGCGILLTVTNLCREIAEYRDHSPLHDDLTLVLLACDESHREPLSEVRNNNSMHLSPSKTNSLHKNKT